MSGSGLVPPKKKNAYKAKYGKKTLRNNRRRIVAMLYAVGIRPADIARQFGMSVRTVWRFIVHEEQNGNIERIHRRLEERLIAIAAVSPYLALISEDERKRAKNINQRLLEILENETITSSDSGSRRP